MFVCCIYLGVVDVVCWCSVLLWLRYFGWVIVLTHSFGFVKCFLLIIWGCLFFVWLSGLVGAIVGYVGLFACVGSYCFAVFCWISAFSLFWLVGILLWLYLLVYLFVCWPIYVLNDLFVLCWFGLIVDTCFGLFVGGFWFWFGWLLIVWLFVCVWFVLLFV